MKLSIRFLRWVFIALYAAIILITMARGFFPGGGDWGGTLLALGILVASQVIFLYGAGTVEICRPIKKRRLLIPVAVASLMGSILVGGLALSLSDLFNVNASIPDYLFLVVLGISWVAWGFVLYVYCRPLDRYSALKRMTVVILGGSLVELLGSIPSHIIVSRRPGCLALHIPTMVGIIAGLYVMLWAFGPGIALLFLRDRYKTAEKQVVDMEGKKE